MTMSSSAIGTELELLLGRNDLGAALVAFAVDLLDLGEPSRMTPSMRAGRRGSPLQLRYALLEVVTGLDLAATERGQPLESKVEDRLRLDLRELELLLEPGARSVDVGRSADQRPSPGRRDCRVP